MLFCDKTRSYLTNLQNDTSFWDEVVTDFAVLGRLSACAQNDWLYPHGLTNNSFQIRHVVDLSDIHKARIIITFIQGFLRGPARRHQDAGPRRHQDREAQEQPPLPRG